MFSARSKGIGILFGLLLAGTVLADSYRIIPMNQKHLATYYVQANMLGSGDVEFMVDTGAGYTTINEHILKQLVDADNATHVGELTGVMADGRELQLPLYRIKRLVLSALEKAAPFIFSTNPPRLSLSNCGAAAS